MSTALHVRPKVGARSLVTFFLVFILTACNGSGGDAGASSSTQATPSTGQAEPVTIGSKSESFILYQDVVAMAGGSAESQSAKMTAVLGQSSPIGDSHSQNYVLVGGSSPE